jgi:hypothetical protein
MGKAGVNDEAMNKARLLRPIWPIDVLLRTEHIQKGVNMQNR